MRKHSAGFTLIELIIVIVILGALAVVALPRFVDLQDEADRAAGEGVAGALASAAAINYAASLTDSPDSFDIDDCDQLPNLLQSEDVPTGYSVTNSALTAGTSSDCTLSTPEGNSVTFRGIGADGEDSSLTP